MLIELLAGLVPVRRRMVALPFGRAMGEPPFGGAAFSLVPFGALAGHPQIDDLCHAEAPVPIAQGNESIVWKSFVAKCAD
jgi:hypothetical protein